MSTIASKLITAEEFAEFLRTAGPDKIYELERGEIVEVHASARLHSLVCANASNILSDSPSAREKGYICGHCAGVIVERDPDTVLGADVMFFADSTMFDGSFGAPPLIAVEVASPSDTMSRMNRRIEQFLRTGTPLVWLLDFDSRTATVFRPNRPHRVLGATDEITCDEILPDFRCKVAEFFAMPGQ